MLVNCFVEKKKITVLHLRAETNRCLAFLIQKCHGMNNLLSNHLNKLITEGFIVELNEYERTE